MKLYRRAEFLDLPVGAAYCKGKPWYFEGINFKTELMEDDWASVDPHNIEAHNSEERVDRLDEMLATGKSYPLETADMRDGSFDGEEVFLVFEKDDLISLRRWIDEAIAVSTQEVARC